MIEKIKELCSKKLDTLLSQKKITSRQFDAFKQLIKNYIACEDLDSLDQLDDILKLLVQD